MRSELTLIALANQAACDRAEVVYCTPRNTGAQYRLSFDVIDDCRATWINCRLALAVLLLVDWHARKAARQLVLDWEARLAAYGVGDLDPMQYEKLPCEEFESGDSIWVLRQPETLRLNG